MDMKKYQPALVGAVLAALAIYGLSWYGSPAERAISAQSLSFYGNPRRAKARRGTGKLTNTERYPWAATVYKAGKSGYPEFREFFATRAEAEKWVKGMLGARKMANMEVHANDSRGQIDFIPRGAKDPVAEVMLAAKWLL